MLNLKRFNRLPSALLLCACVSCGNEGSPRPQLVVEIDTDVPTLEQALADEAFSLDASLDTLRVDVIGDSGEVVDFLDVVAPTPDDWPVSFGALPPTSGSRVRFRMRLFRGEHATRGILNGVPTLEPAPALVIDRVVDLEFPSSGVKEARILLAGDCLGIPSTFGQQPRSCIDAATPSAPSTAGVEPRVTGETQVGTWPLAKAVPCTGAQPPGTRCVAGGFAILGDAELVGLGIYLNAAPLVPAFLDPFWMDETEYTVGRYRESLAAHGEPTEPVLDHIPGDVTRGQCNFHGAEAETQDSFALNCVEWPAMRELCQRQGGDLPSEAQWEFAARGRGQGRIYPWGSEAVECCMTSISRFSLPGVPLACPAETGPEPVGSHLPSPACNGIGDQSRDGLLDLGGSVSELTLDNARAYDDACWTRSGIHRNPLCSLEGGLVSLRGGNFSTGPQLATGALRSEWSKIGWSGGIGGRCTYPAGSGE